MAVNCVAFMSVAGHHIITWKHRKDPQSKVQLPLGFWIVASSAFDYLLLVFFGIYLTYPNGVDLGPSVSLRIASAAALFFGVASLGFTQRTGLRVRALQSAP